MFFLLDFDNLVYGLLRVWINRSLFLLLFVLYSKINYCWKCLYWKLFGVGSLIGLSVGIFDGLVGEFGYLDCWVFFGNGGKGWGKILFNCRWRE